MPILRWEMHAKQWNGTDWGILGGGGVSPGGAFLDGGVMFSSGKIVHCDFLIGSLGGRRERAGKAPAHP